MTGVPACTYLLQWVEPFIAKLENYLCVHAWYEFQLLNYKKSVCGFELCICENCDWLSQNQQEPKCKISQIEYSVPHMAVAIKLEIWLPVKTGEPEKNAVQMSYSSLMLSHCPLFHCCYKMSWCMCNHPKTWCCSCGCGVFSGRNITSLIQVNSSV